MYVYMQVFSQGCFNCCLVILADCPTGWETVENFYASTECTFLKTRQVGIWSVKMMIIPFINIVYR